MTFKYCIVQYLAWLAGGRKIKKLFECKDCPIKSNCDKAESEDKYTGVSE